MTDEIFVTRGTCTIWSNAEFDTNYNNLGQHSLSSIASSIIRDRKFDRSLRKRKVADMNYKKNKQTQEDK